MKYDRIGALLCGVALISFAVPSVALAQGAASDSSQSQDAADAGEDSPIVVTGSRIVRDGADAPTPVTVVGADRLKELGITNVGEALNQVPAFRPTVSPATNGLNAASAGARIADLRGLGPLRTLVLVDGRRFTPSTAQGTVDLNMIPAAMIDRVEVVTGGASAVYGSDAVAGVVNLILDDRLEGLRASAQYGQSDHSDNKDYTVSLAAGTGLFGGSGHLVVGGEYDENKGVGDCMTRDWCQPHYGTIFNPTPGVDGLPALIMIQNANASGLTPGGLITAPGPLAGIQFGPDGQPVGGYQFGKYYSPSGVFMQGGTGEGDRDAYLSGYLLKVPVTRYSAYAHFDVDLGSGIEGFADLSYGQVKGAALSAQTRDKTLMISVDNPFLPDSLHDTMVADGITSFTFGRSGLDLGRAQIATRTRTINGVAGLKGELGGGWNWDGYYQFGTTKYRQITSNDRITANFAQALDAVRAPDGSIVCRSSLADPGNGCSPLDLFGENRFSSAAKDYAFGTARQDATFKQQVGALNISGSPFDSWAGAVKLAAGVEYRVEESNSVADPISRNLGFYVSNAQDIAGQQKVLEGYVETVVPLLKDSPFARLLEFNGGLRRTHYSVEGAGTDNSFNATTWKLGLVYQPVSWLRFRGARSRDIRAPNISELYGARTQTFAVTADPATNSSVFLPIPQPSNPFLVPEVADTLTVGATVTPDQGVLAGLRFSADYYEVKIDQAIARPGSQAVVNRCIAGATEFCGYVQRNSSGGLVSVTNPLLNLNAQTVRGIDFELGYRVSAGAGRSVNFRMLATHVFNLITTDSAGSIDRAGQTGFPVGGVPGLPDWVFDAIVSYQGGPLTLTAQSHFVSAGYNDVTRVGPDSPDYDPALPNSTNINRLPGRVYFNLAGSYDLARTGNNGKIQLFGAIDNVFDQDPPGIHNDQIATNGILFDTIGRTYRVGVRFSY